MNIRNVLFAGVLVMLMSHAFSQCFTQGGVQGFESGLGDFWQATEGLGTIATTTEDSYVGNSSLKATVNSSNAWEVRMSNLGSCGFTVNTDEVHVLSFYAKGSTDGLESQIFLFGTGGSMSKTIFLTDEWQLYTVVYRTDFSATDAKFRMVFKSIGEYYVDEMGLNRHDCNGDISGSATLDACDICSGGNTGKTPFATCTLQDNAPNDPNIVFEGVRETNLTPTKATFYRFTEDYATDPDGGHPSKTYYNRSRSAGTAGVVIKFKTASPKIVVTLNDNDVYGSAANSNKPTTIYKDGVIYGVVNDTEITIDYSGSQNAEWSLVLPVYNWMELLNIQTLPGYDLEPITTPAKPAYVAIGNSITQGVGTSLQTSHTTYARRIANERGYELYNWGIGGSYIFSDVTSNFDGSGLDPELITILWGFNDVNARGDSYVYSDSYPQYDALIGDLCTRFPNATILAMTPIVADPSSVNETAISNLDSMRLNQEWILERHQQTCPNLHYLRGEEHTSLADVPMDGVHPSDDGNATIANALLAELDVVASTSSRTLEANDWAVYPNPTTDVLHLGRAVSEVSVYDMSGVLVKSFGADELKSISLKGMESGAYVIKGSTEDGTTISQFIQIQK